MPDCTEDCVIDWVGTPDRFSFMEDIFTPLAGGILIGLGSLLAMAGSGKVPGISGVAARILRVNRGDTAWRVVFLIGLMAGAWLAMATGAGWEGYSLPAGRTLPVYAAAGLLVGFGTRVGGGCTSGHGVCGIGAGARDSLIYTCVFMVAAIITVAVWSKMTGGAA